MNKKSNMDKEQLVKRLMATFLEELEEHVANLSGGGLVHSR